MAHLIRGAMIAPVPPVLGGEGKVVKADEMYQGKRETPTPSPTRRGAPYLKRKRLTYRRVGEAAHA